MPFHNYNHQQPKLGFPSLWAEAAPIQKYFGPQATFDNSYFLHASTGEAHCHRGSFYRQRRRSSAKIWLRRRRHTVVWDKQESVLLSAVIGVPTKTKTGVTVIAPSTQSIRQTKTITWCQTYRAAPNPFWHVSGGASIGGSALPQAVIIIL